MKLPATLVLVSSVPRSTKSRPLCHFCDSVYTVPSGSQTAPEVLPAPRPAVAARAPNSSVLSRRLCAQAKKSDRYWCASRNAKRRVIQSSKSAMSGGLKLRLSGCRIWFDPMRNSTLFTNSVSLPFFHDCISFFARVLPVKLARVYRNRARLTRKRNGGEVMGNLR
jgi:hypothetical protein